MGATKAADDAEVRWVHTGKAIINDDFPWQNNPNTDVGQFYAERNNISCLLIGQTSVWSIFMNYMEWGIKIPYNQSAGRALCASKEAREP